MLILAVWASPAHAAHIFIDPGHGSILVPGGGVDPGAVSAGFKEKDIALQISFRLASELRARGHTVSLYRTGDVTTAPVDRNTWQYTEVTDTWAWGKDGTIWQRDSLQARSDAANAAGADLFISVHLNAYTTTTANGYETYSAAEDRLGASLAASLQREVLEEIPLRDRGAATAGFYVLRWSHMPAALVECGFISNPTDRAYVTSVAGQTAFARGMAEGVDAFLASDPYRPLWERVAGATRYGTAAALSCDGWPDGARTVLLATGEDWPDALASAPLSGALDAPLLLSAPGTLPTETAQELERLNPERIVVLGGTGVVSENVAAAAADAAGLTLADVTRIGGADRYETAGLIAAEVGVPDDGRVCVVTGSSPADAVSISAYAGANKIPILLVSESAIPTPTAAFAEANSETWESTLIIGGTGVISGSVEATLPAPTRLAGPDRYATNTAVLDQLYRSAGTYYVVNGQAYPDCLTAGVRGARDAGAIMLVHPKTLGNHQRLYIENHETLIKRIRMVGGTGVLPIMHEWMIDKALR